MKIINSLLMLAVVWLTVPVAAQVGQNWSRERNVLPEGFGASEAKVVLLRDGSINITFRGGETDDPQVGGIFFTRSVDQGYSWTKPRAAVQVSSVQGITHQLLGDGENLLLFITVNRLARYEVHQYLSTDRGLTWNKTETVFSEKDLIRAGMSWQQSGQIFLMVLTERLRPGGESEFDYWLVRGRSSGAYWEPAVRVHNFFASEITPPALSPGRPWPSIFWKVNSLQSWLLEVNSEDGSRWTSRPIDAAPPAPGEVLEDRGIFYRVRTTENRQLLFNRTDDEAPTTQLITNIPRSLDEPRLRISWQGKDNYTLGSQVEYHLRLDEGEPAIIRDATTHEFTELINGSHRLSLVAIDEAGNSQSPATTKSFRVKVPPQSRFVSPRNGDLLPESDVTVHWEGSHNCLPEDILLFSLKVNDGDWSDFAEEDSKLAPGLSDGEHAVHLRARDAQDNESAEPVTVRFEVDVTPPSCVAEELPRNWEVTALGLTWDVNPKYSVEYQLSGTDNRTSGDELEYRYKLDDNPLTEWTPIGQTISLSGLKDGLHSIDFYVRDEAGNIQPEPTALKFAFNTPPDTRVWFDETEAEYRFAGKDDNSETRDITFRWRIDEGNWSDWSSSNTLSSSLILGGIAHGNHILQVQGRDGAGTEDPRPAELEIEVDKRPPPPPTNLTLMPRDDGAEVSLSWDPSAESGVYYNVWRSTSEQFSKESVTLVDGDRPQTRSTDRPVPGAETATFYYFVTATDRSMNESEPSNPAQVIVLGNEARNEKKFNTFKLDVDNLIRGGRWSEVISKVQSAPPGIFDPDARRAYPVYWKLVAEAKNTLETSPEDLVQLKERREALKSFVREYSTHPLASDMAPLFDEVKSKLLWIGLKLYGVYAIILIVLLIVIAMVYRWVQQRKIPEMPMIHAADSGTEAITPSKEALKDPTVLRRWAEVQAESGSAENWSRLAFAFHNIGEIENAIQSLYKSLEIEPNNTRFHFQMGHFQKEAGRPKEAIRHFERYLQLNPESKKSAEEVKELIDTLKKGAEE